MRVNRIIEAWKGPSECAACGIRHLALFCDLQEQDFVHLHQPIEDQEFSAGETLYGVGDPGQAVFTVRSGLIKLIQYLPNGDQRIVRLLRQGDATGLEALLGQDYKHAAVFLQPGMVCRIPCDVVHRLNATTPRLYRQLMIRWERSVTQADEWLTKLSTGTARNRVARLLLFLAAHREDRTCRLFSREDLAAMLGLTTETVSRVIAEFRREGLIDQQRPNLFGCDLEALADMAEAGQARPARNA